jgi:hypothetical protein
MRLYFYIVHTHRLALLAELATHQQHISNTLATHTHRLALLAELDVQVCHGVI